MKFLMSLLLVTVVSTQGASAKSADNEQARKAFVQGTKLFEQNKFDEAAASFQKSYDLRPSWKILLNIGQCHAAAKNFGSALEAFTAYLSQGGDDVPVEKRDEIVAEIRIMKELVGQLQAEAPNGAEIIIDGLNRGRFPLPGPILISVGVNHDVKVVKDETILLQKTIRVNSGTTILLTVPKKDPGPDAKPVAGAEQNTQAAADDSEHTAPTKTTTAHKAPYSKPLRIGGWVTAGTGIGLLVAGVITGATVLSLNKKNLSDECAVGCEDLPQQIKNLQVSTNVLLGEGAGVTCIGAAILIYSYVKQKKNAKRVSLLPEIRSDRLGLKLAYDF